MDDEFLMEGQDAGIDISPDFVAPEIPKKQSVRFAKVNDQDIEKLQSERTHKQTTWAVKILTGNIRKHTFKLFSFHENILNPSKKFTVILMKPCLGVLPFGRDHVISWEGTVCFYKARQFSAPHCLNPLQSFNLGLFF